jgi:hypothetical protein
MNSKRKGKNGELEAAKALNAAIPSLGARRSQQFSGKSEGGTADLKTNSKLFIEVKRRQRGNIDKWLMEVEENCPDGWAPCVAFRRDRGDWIIALRIHNLADFVVAVLGLIHNPKAIKVDSSYAKDTDDD